MEIRIRYLLCSILIALSSICSVFAQDEADKWCTEAQKLENSISKASSDHEKNVLTKKAIILLDKLFKRYPQSECAYSALTALLQHYEDLNKSQKVKKLHIWIITHLPDTEYAKESWKELKYSYEETGEDFSKLKDKWYYRKLAAQEKSRKLSADEYWNLAEYAYRKQKYKAALHYLRYSINTEGIFCGEALESTAVRYAIMSAQCYAGLGEIDTALNIIGPYVQRSGLIDNSSAITSWGGLLKKKYGSEYVKEELEKGLKSIFVEPIYSDVIVLPFMGIKLDFYSLMTSTERLKFYKELESRDVSVIRDLFRQLDFYKKMQSNDSVF